MDKDGNAPALRTTRLSHLSTECSISTASRSDFPSTSRFVDLQWSVFRSARATCTAEVKGEKMARSLTWRQPGLGSSGAFNHWWPLPLESRTCSFILYVDHWWLEGPFDMSTPESLHSSALSPSTSWCPNATRSMPLCLKNVSVADQEDISKPETLPKTSCIRKVSFTSSKVGSLSGQSWLDWQIGLCSSAAGIKPCRYASGHYKVGSFSDPCQWCSEWSLSAL